MKFKTRNTLIDLTKNPLLVKANQTQCISLITTRSKGISNSKRELGIEVAIRSFQVNKNHESIV